MAQRTIVGEDAELSATRLSLGRNYSGDGVQQTDAQEGNTNIPVIIKNVDSLLEGFRDCEPTGVPFPAHMKQKVLELLHKLEHDFANIHLLRSLCALLKEVSLSVPKHLRPTLSGLEQTLVAGRSQLLDRVADKNAFFIEPEELASGNSDLVAAKKMVVSVSCTIDVLRSDIAEVTSKIEKLIAKKATLEELLASNEKKLVDYTESLSTELKTAEERLKRFHSFKKAESLEDEAKHSLVVAVDCLAKFFESL